MFSALKSLGHKHAKNTCMNLGMMESINPVAQTFYKVSAIITFLLAVPAILLNVKVIVKYFKIHPSERRQNTNLLILHQAIADLFNAAINSPLNAIVNIIYYAYQPHITKMLGISLEDSCPYVYILASCSMNLSLVSTLLIFILIAVNRLIATWQPNLWFSELRYSHRCEVKICIAGTWAFAFLFSSGELLHISEFSHGEHRSVDFYHLMRFVVCFLLVVILIALWLATFWKIYSSTVGNIKLNDQSVSIESNRRKRQNIIIDTTSSSISSTSTTSSYTRTTISSNIVISDNRRVTRKTSERGCNSCHCRQMSALDENNETQYNVANISKKTTKDENVKNNKISMTTIGFDICEENRDRNKQSQQQSNHIILFDKTVRIFVQMLGFFVVGYLPMLGYFYLKCSKYLHAEQHTHDAVWILFSASFLALMLSSCLNPILVLLKMDHYKLKWDWWVKKRFQAVSRWRRSSKIINLVRSDVCHRGRNDPTPLPQVENG